MAWWMWLLVAALCVGASAFGVMLSLSAGTAFGTDYHAMSPQQRTMGRWLYRSALLAALVFGLAGGVALLLAVRPLLG